MNVSGKYNQDLYDGKRVLILPGPHSSNLTHGFVGRTVDVSSLGDEYLLVRVESGDSGWVGEVAVAHVDQLIGVDLAALMLVVQMSGGL